MVVYCKFASEIPKSHKVRRIAESELLQPYGDKFSGLCVESDDVKGLGIPLQRIEVVLLLVLAPQSVQR